MEKGKEIKQLRLLARSFPDHPGVYIMKNNASDIIYIGKAISLRNRVSSYFSGKKDAKTAVLVKRIDTIDFILTENEYDALILENNLIKEHKPKYNINLKDGKTYPMIRITNEKFPRVFRTRRLVNDGSRYFGPYPQVQAVDTYLDLIERLYPLRKCRGKLLKRKNPCLYYHIGRCHAPCVGKTSAAEYNSYIDEIVEMLSGTTKELRQSLETQMETAASELRFERAAQLRDSIRSLVDLEENQSVMDFGGGSSDYIQLSRDGDYCVFGVSQLRDGKLISRDLYRTHVYSSDSEDLAQFLMLFYQDHEHPERIILPISLDEWDLSETLSPGSRFDKTENKRDESILNMTALNCKEELVRWRREEGDIPGLEELKLALNLKKLPMRIEGYDIAQLHGKHTVAALISFNKGVPDKANYRKYHIKTLKGAIDDFESMREVIARRYSRLLNEKKKMPDLILIDGGKGQVNAAYEIISALGLEKQIPIVGIAKREEELFKPHTPEPVILPEGSPGLRILQHVRDEAHRFSTTFNQKLRSSDLKIDSLETIPGMGPGRSKRVLKEYPDLSEILDTESQEVAENCGLPVDVVEKIKESLRLKNELGSNE